MFALSALFSYTDWILTDGFESFLRVQGLRLAGLAPVTVLVLTGRSSHPPREIQFYAFLSACTFLTSLLLISSFLPPDPVAVAVAAAMALSVYTVIPLRFIWRLLAAGFYSIGATAVLVAPLNPEVQASTLFLLLMVNVLGIAAARNGGTARRREFLLLHRIFPQSVILRMQRGERIADEFPHVSVLFADLVGFTEHSRRLGPRRVVGALDQIFGEFDRLCDIHGVEKIKTIGDSYMAATGLSDDDAHRAEHNARKLLRMAREMLEAVRSFEGGQLKLRIGVHSGPVYAGVIGTRRQLYDLWGDTVNVASRMESHGLPDSIQISARTRALIEGEESFRISERGPIDIKGSGWMPAYLVAARRRARAQSPLASDAPKLENEGPDA